MRSFKMKDLMIRIQPETSGKVANALQNLTGNFLAGHNFGTCTSPSCASPSTICSGANSCRPTRCPDKPKPKPKHHENEVLEDIVELSDLKAMLAEMQINMSSHTAETAPVL